MGDWRVAIFLSSLKNRFAGRMGGEFVQPERPLVENGFETDIQGQGYPQLSIPLNSIMESDQ